MPRHLHYSDALSERICDELMEGKSLVQICDAADMPNRRTILRWMEKDDAFATRCARARELQADLMDDQIIRLIEQCTPETAPADRVKLAALQWRASKLAPKKYGDRLVTEHTGKDGGPIQTEDVSARDLLIGRIAGLSARLEAASGPSKPH